MEKKPLIRNIIISALSGLSVLTGLYITSLYSYLLFHSLVEIFSVIVIFVIFVLAWNTRHVQENNYLLFIGVTALFSGAFQLTHALAYKGFGVFPNHDANLPTQLWIVYRYMFSLSFLAAPFFMARKMRAWIIAVYSIVSSLLFAAIFRGIFPDCYLEGLGLTPFKIISEYIIILIFIASLGLLIWKRNAFDSSVLRLMSGSILASVVAEFSFTKYASVFGLANLIGHLFLLLSVYFIYHAIIVTGLMEPSRLLFRNLKQSEEELRVGEAKYRSLFDNMINGFAYHKIILGKNGKPDDYTFLEVNASFEKLTGLKKENIVGKSVREVLPGIESDPADWIGRYGEVALTGKETRFEQFSESLGKWFSVSAYSPAKGYFVALFEDITDRKRAGKAIEHLASFPQLNPNPVIEIAANGNVTFFNSATIEILKQVRADGDPAAFCPGDIKDILNSLGQGEETQYFYREVTIKDRVFAENIYSSKNLNVIRIYATDITEIKRTEAALRLTTAALEKSKAELEVRVGERTRDLAEQSRILESFFRHTQTSLVFLDREFNFLRVNEAYAKACGRDVSDFAGHNHFADYPSEELKGKFRQVVDTGEPFTVLGRPFVFPDHPEWGVTYWDMTVSPVLDSKGEVDFLVFSLVDVTEQRRAAEKLKAERQRFYDVLETLPAYIVLLTPDYHVRFANRIFRELFGESQGRRCFEFLFGRSEPCEVCETYSVLKTSKPHEWEWTGPNGRNYFIHDFPFFDADGSTLILEMGIDITERKQAENRISVSNAFLKLFSETFSRREYLDSAVVLLQGWTECRCTGIRILDKHGNIPYESYTGFSKEFWDMENFLSINHDQCACIRVITEKPDPQDMPVITGKGSFYTNNSLEFVNCLSSEEKARFRGTCIKNGFRSIAIIPISYGEEILGAIHLADERENVVPLKTVESVETITPLIGEAIHRFNIEDEVRHSNELLEKVFSNIHVLIAYMDAEFNFIRVNRFYAEADGRETEFFIGKNHFALYPNEENEEIFKKVVATGEPYYAYAKPFEYAEHPERGITYWDWSLQPVKDPLNKVQGLVLSLMNVTDKVKLQGEAMQSAHLASLGELAAGVAHEINNPLNGIINYAQMLSNKLKKPSLENDVANRIIKEGDRIANIVRSLLSFARKRTEEKGFFNIENILNDSLMLTEAQLSRDNIKIKVNMPKDLPGIVANSQQIQQVFLNVINNARYALNQKYPSAHDDKILEISGRQVTIDGREYIRTIFHDRGTGIPSDIIDKIINPFFSTKPSGSGTGLGLSISHGIISDHGGTFRIESVEGKFSRIIIDLPAATKGDNK